jgi:hypothetical protein
MPSKRAEQTRTLMGDPGKVRLKQVTAWTCTVCRGGFDNTREGKREAEACCADRKTHLNEAVARPSRAECERMAKGLGTHFLKVMARDTINGVNRPKWVLTDINRDIDGADVDPHLEQMERDRVHGVWAVDEGKTWRLYRVAWAVWDPES